jgi:hypothetical protein
MNFVLARVKVIEQTLGVQRAARPGNSDKDLQAESIMAMGRRSDKWNVKRDA